MPYSATLLDIRDEGDRILGVLLYTDGVSRKFTETMSLDRLTSDSFLQTVAARINQLNDNAVFLDGLKVGPIDVSKVLG